MPGRRRRYGGAEAGVTLIEMVISIVVISIAVTGTLLAMEKTIGRSANPMLVHQAVAIAEAYMDEILLHDFRDPDPPNAICGNEGENRDVWDDVCDFNRIQDGPEAWKVGVDTPPKDHLGANFGGGLLDEYTVEVRVTDTNDLGLADSNDELKIEVHVQHRLPELADITLISYRTFYAQ